jgi:hypothetical protein
MPTPRRSTFKTRITTSDGRTVEKEMLEEPAEPPTTPGELPAFAAPPGSKAYYGFPLIDGVAAGGWKMGAMTYPLQPDTEAGCTIGDAYVQAPDGTRAGIVWETGPELKFTVLVPPDEKRWGVYKIHVPRAVRTWEDFHDNFRTMLPLLKHLHSRRATPDG